MHSSPDAACIQDISEPPRYIARVRILSSQPDAMCWMLIDLYTATSDHLSSSLTSAWTRSLFFPYCITSSSPLDAVTHSLCGHTAPRAVSLSRWNQLPTPLLHSSPQTPLVQRRPHTAKPASSPVKVLLMAVRGLRAKTCSSTARGIPYHPRITKWPERFLWLSVDLLFYR